MILLVATTEDASGTSCVNEMGTDCSANEDVDPIEFTVDDDDTSIVCWLSVLAA